MIESSIEVLLQMEIVELKDWRESLLQQIEKNYDKIESIAVQNKNLLSLAQKIGQVIDLKGE